MRHSILHTAGNVVWVARRDPREAVPLLGAYARLKARELASRADGSDDTSIARFLGLEVSFFDAYWLVEMFEEIFLRDQYRFAPSRPRPLILDVGSNVGLSILYFKREYPDARVVGFEPDPRTFAVLERNVRQNGLSDVTLVEAAVSDGRESLVLHADVPGSPQASTTSMRAATGARSTTVRADRLSRHVADEVDLLKLDVEGAEGTVLAELADAGRLPLVREIVMEYHHHLDSHRDELSDVLSLLEGAGFGYGLEARVGPRDGRAEGAYQNVLVHAYRK